jgi:tRNA threonylcarbamoyladenosine biosynthesis protein TsaB
MTPQFLTFDTATEHLSIAISTADQVHVFEGPGGILASARLIPAIYNLLREAQINLGDLSAIGFGRGPGAFTGLRTACSVAQGLALGANKPVLPIDSLLAVAEDARSGNTAPNQKIWVVMDARMGEIYAAQYLFNAGVWAVLDAPMLTTAAALNMRWQIQTPTTIAGNALNVPNNSLNVGDVSCWPHALPRATGMLTLAQSMWMQSDTVDAASALPLYLRDKVAQTTHERDVARQAKNALVSAS